MRGKQFVVITLAVVLALGLAGCKAASEKVAEEIAGAAVGGDVSVDGDEVTIETDEGSVSVSGEEGTLPDDFPADFPKYPGNKVASATRMAGGSDVSFYIGLTSDDDPLDVYDWYAEKCASAGWTFSSETRLTQAGSEGGLLTMTKDAATCEMLVAPADAGAEISLILTMPK